MRTLVFADRKSAGAYPVTDATGTVVAQIRVTGWGTSFTVTDAAGTTLCAGSTNRWGMSNVWRATGQGGESLLQVRKSLLRAAGVLTLARGGDLTIEGGVWRRTFAVRDGDRAVLSAVPQASMLSLRPYEYAVTHDPAALTLAEAIAVVEIWRLLRKRDDTSSAGAATTAVIAAS